MMRVNENYGLSTYTLPNLNNIRSCLRSGSYSNLVEAPQKRKGLPNVIQHKSNCGFNYLGSNYYIADVNAVAGSG